MKLPSELEVTLPHQAPPTAGPLAAGADAASTAVCYDNEVPDFVEAEIARCHGSLFSTLAHLRHKGALTTSTSTYVSRRGGTIDTVLLFERRGQRIVVLNELIHLSRSVIGDFLAFIFARDASVSSIAFNAVSADLEGLCYPCQHFVCAEDIVLASLTSAEAYTASLSLNTRKSLRRNTNGVLRRHPDFQFAIVPPQDVNEELVRRIIGFNKARMAAKDRVSAFNDKESGWIVAMVRAHGVVSVLTIHGQVCAGVAACKVGSHYFMLVGAHDPGYDEFGLGMLCCYQSICASIATGATDWHLLWGRQRYKTSLGAMPRRYDRISVYRNRRACWREPVAATLAALTGYLREARLWLVNTEAQDSLAGRIVTRLWRIGRPAKRRIRTMLAWLRPRRGARP